MCSSDLIYVDVILLLLQLKAENMVNLLIKIGLKLLMISLKKHMEKKYLKI